MPANAPPLMTENRERMSWAHAPRPAPPWNPNEPYVRQAFNLMHPGEILCSI